MAAKKTLENSDSCIIKCNPQRALAVEQARFFTEDEHGNTVLLSTYDFDTKKLTIHVSKKSMKLNAKKH